MDKNEHKHHGHRGRIYEKFVKNADVLADHELLEMLLFNFIPRKDTNSTAHDLISRFGSLKGVFEASISELMTVEGIGRRTAINLSVVGKIISTIKPCEQSKFSMYTFEEVKGQLVEYFHGKKEEEMLFVLLDKSYKEISRLAFSDRKAGEVTVNITDLANEVAFHRPAHVLIAHNHLSDSATPSEADDKTTSRIFVMLEVHGVDLIDHVIVSKKEVYSYNKFYRLNFIKDSVDLYKAIGKIKED